LHQKDQEGPAKLVDPHEHAGDGRSMELEGDLRQAEGANDELDDSKGLGT
jgi:hypothetical protein